MESPISSLICVNDFEEKAEQILPRSILGYYKSGATQETTLRENREAFKRWYIRPRFLRDVSTCDISTSVLGHPVRMPVGVAPTAMQKMAHADGECGIAKATRDNGVPYVLSTLSTTPLEDVAKSTDVKFFQLYIYKDRNLTADIIRRAEKAGFQAVVLTVDAPMFGIRYADVRNNFELPKHLRLANFQDKLSSTLNSEGSGIGNYVNSLFDPSIQWKDIAWLKSITNLPIVLKGIMTPEDALKGLEEGAKAIWVSNHGARQLDGVLSTIDVLPEIVEAVGDRCEVYVDGGFRTGTDVYKALALGARMVFVGRPVVWGLACGGQLGADKVLKILKTELLNALKLSGYSSISSIKPSCVIRGFRSRI